MAKKSGIINPTREELLEYERDVLGINLTSIMNPYKLKMKFNGFENVAYLKDIVDNELNKKNILICGIVKFIEVKESKAGNTFYWIGIVDDHSFIKVYCNDKIFKEYSNEIIKNQCSLFSISVNNGFVVLDRCRLIDNVPFKAGYIFVIHLDFNIHTDDILNYIEDNLDVSINRGNVEVYQKTRGSDLMIDPSYTLIDIIKRKFGVKCTIENKDEYLFPNSLKLIDYYDELLSKQ